MNRTEYSFVEVYARQIASPFELIIPQTPTGHSIQYKPHRRVNRPMNGLFEISGRETACLINLLLFAKSLLDFYLHSAPRTASALCRVTPITGLGRMEVPRCQDAAGPGGWMIKRKIHPVEADQAEPWLVARVGVRSGCWGISGAAVIWRLIVNGFIRICGMWCGRCSIRQSSI